MYEKPSLQRFGTLRELTQAASIGGDNDGFFWCGVPCDQRNNTNQPLDSGRS